MWLLLNSAGPVQRHRGPHRLGGVAELGPPEVDVHLLQLVGGRRDPPEHEVGVGAHPLQVIAARG